MNILELPLVIEKKHWTVIFHPINILFYYIALIILLTIIIPVFNLDFHWIIYSFCFFIGAYFFSLKKFHFSFDYLSKGKIRFTTTSIDLLIPDLERSFPISSSTFKLLFDGVRNGSISSGAKDFPRCGISILIINDNIKCAFILPSEAKKEELVKLINFYYSKEVVLDEVLRYEGQHRLVALNMNFNWVEFKTIEANNKRRRHELNNQAKTMKS